MQRRYKDRMLLAAQEDHRLGIRQRIVINRHGNIHAGCFQILQQQLRDRAAAQYRAEFHLISERCIDAGRICDHAARNRLKRLHLHLVCNGRPARCPVILVERNVAYINGIVACALCQLFFFFHTSFFRTKLWTQRMLSTRSVPTVPSRTIVIFTISTTMTGSR